MEDWQVNKQQRREQVLTLQALESGDFDNMTDEQWCRYLETGKVPKEELHKNLLDDPDWLRREYLERDRTIDSIAFQAGCSKSTVSKHITKYRLFKRQNNKAETIHGFSKALIHRMYWKEALSIPEIATSLGISQGCLTKFFIRTGIPRRKLKEAVRLHVQKRGYPHPWNLYSIKNQGANN